MILPAEGRLLIKKLERDEAATDSGVLLPGTQLQEESLRYGEVVSDGHSTFKKGMKIFYSRYSATKVMDNKGNEFFIVSDLDVMAVDDDTKKV